NGVLAIHGSIPISEPHPVREIFKRSVDRVETSRIAHLSEWLKPEEISEFPNLIALSFAEFFGEEHLIRSSPSILETKVAEFLEREKYADLFWNKRGDCSSLGVQAMQKFSIERMVCI
ncbi:hypothetical protein HYY75_10745, partial [bacterium]|nr:hypothetical protein [bacterium]